MMSWLVDTLFALTICFVRTVKWIEFSVLLLFSPLVEKFVKGIMEDIGVVIHTTPQSFPTWTQSDSRRVLEKLKSSEYQKLIHIKVNSLKWFSAFASNSSMALGEGFRDKEWEFCDSKDDIIELIHRLLRSDTYAKYGLHPWNRFVHYLDVSLFNRQTLSRAWQVGEEHYDLGNDLFEGFLDPWMQYTCGYWANADNLNDAQLHKMDLIARKLQLRPGMRVLDIGCGWGTLCKYLAQNYGVECVGVTIAKEGAAYGRKVCEGLPVEIRIQDYRAVNEKFDRIVSIGMFEHVGHWNQRDFLKVAHRCLKDDGIFLLHTIGNNHSSRKIHRTAPWVDKYVFPNGNMPYMWEIVKNTEDLFVVEDWHNFGTDYDKTLVAWRENFLKNRDSILKSRGEKFFRTWMFYFAGAAACFRSRRHQLWQVVLTKDGLLDGYRAPR